MTAAGSRIRVWSFVLAARQRHALGALPSPGLGVGVARFPSQVAPPLSRRTTPLPSPPPQGGREQIESAAALIPPQRPLESVRSRIIAVSQTLRGGQVEPSIHVDDHAIVAPRCLRGDQAVAHVVEDALRIAGAWISDAAAPRQLEADRVARRHGLPPLRPDGPAGARRHRAGRARTATVASARGVVHALEIAQERDRRRAGAAELDHLAEPAAQPAGAAGALPQFTSIEYHRSHAL